MLSVIDTASPQRALDLTIPFGAGYHTNYVKLGGDNVPRYVAPNYVTQVDRSRAIGYRVGHYWVPSAAADPAGAADYFVVNLRGWDKSRDFVVLDNESLDGATLYSDAQAAAWVDRVRARLGIPGPQVLVYYGLGEARARTHSAVLATGANFIIAAYSYAAFTFATPSNIPRERIVGHQTGQQTFGGVVTDVNSFTDNAFDFGSSAPAGGVMSLEPKAREFAAKYPTPADSPSPSTATTWDQNCGIAMFQFGSFIGWTKAPSGDITSAYRAYRGSKIESTNPVGAPVGAYHWFDIGGEANGHVAQQVDGNTLIFMGSAAVWENLRVDIGFGSVADYLSKRPTAKYLGWSRDYSGGTINLATVSGGGITPIEEDDMFSESDRTTLNNTYAAVWKGGSVTIDGVVQKFNYGILPVVVHNQTLIAQQSGRIAALESAVSQLAASGGGSIDIAAVQEAARAGAATALSGLGFPTVEQIASAVNDEAADRLAS